MAEVDAKPKSTAPALRALMADVIDYAGIFPPASLSLEQAIENFASYLGSDEAWMLARFIIPTRRLPDLEAYAHLFENGSPPRFSVLPSSGDTGDAFLDAFASDLKEIQRFRQKLRASVDQLEFRLPREFLETDVVHVRRFLDRIEAALDAADLNHLDLFIEIPLDAFLRQTLPILTGALTVYNRSRTAPDLGRACVKMRTGGTEPNAFPSSDDVAYLITACRDAAVPFKATAGLHHPVRHVDDALGMPMHGFLNVFGAAALAFANDLDEKITADILRDEDASHFRFTEEALEWKHFSASLQAIERVRADRALSFGSCSFEEPIEDLKALEHL